MKMIGWKKNFDNRCCDNPNCVRDKTVGTGLKPFSTKYGFKI